MPTDHEVHIDKFSTADNMVRHLGQFGHSSSSDPWGPLEDSDEGRKELCRRIDALLVAYPAGTHCDVRLSGLRRYRAKIGGA